MLTDQSLGMDTTCGTAALVGARGSQNAEVVDMVSIPRSESLLNIWNNHGAAPEGRDNHHWQGEPLGTSLIARTNVSIANG